MAESRARLLRRVQIACFAAHEAALFLDTHPADAEALAYYKRYRDLAADATASYESQYGPLTVSAADEGWNWTDNPWPWDYEANV